MNIYREVINLSFYFGRKHMIIKDIVVKNDKDKEFELEVYLNIASIKGIERELKQIDPKLNFYKALPLIPQGEMTISVIFIGNCLHRRGEKRPVGSEWFDANDVNFFKYSDELIAKLTACLEDLNPTVKDEGK